MTQESGEEAVNDAVVPSREELEKRVRHFANSVFLIGSGVLMLLANVLQPFAAQVLGAESGSQTVFISATLLILFLASKRSAFALHAAKKQCAKYGHVTPNGAPACSRCGQVVNPQQ